MENFYYSKKLNQYFSKRLDFLIYAHDGRGFGHASRSIAIGMAMRRLFPKCKTLFVSGCKQSRTLIGSAPLDWIKIPSYATTVSQGLSEGADGDANFYKSALADLRAEMLASIVKIFKPRSVLVDHSPAGKREELHLALKESQGTDTRWVLGLRGVVGHDKDVWSSYSTELFKKYYDAILWYGDARVLGHDYQSAIADHFGVESVETGYVSRLREISQLKAQERFSLAGTIAIPWLGDVTRRLIESICSALNNMGDRYGQWRLFVPKAEKSSLQHLLKGLSYSTVEEISENYIPSLINSRVALVYGGYNSLIDVLAAQVPSVVLLRGMRDREQEDHIARLRALTGEFFQVLAESKADAQSLQEALEKQLNAPADYKQAINIDGAERAAMFLAEGVLCEG